MMSNLSAFLNPAVPAEEKEVIISNRFQENGKPIPFKIRALTQEENDQISKRCSKNELVNGQWVNKLDSIRYSRELVCAGTVEPNFASKQVCDHFKVADPALVPGKMLLAGEFAKLMNEIMRFSGFDENIGEAAKN